MNTSTLTHRTGLRANDPPVSIAASAATSLAAPPSTSSATRGVARPSVGFGVLIAIAAAAQFMVVLDGSIVNVALPSMRESLHLSVSAQQWVVNGYLIAFGGLLLLFARASDLFGRRRVFQAGLIVFTLASLLGGLAQDGPMLLVARIIQGAGAAALGPASLSLITAAARDDDQRARGLTLWGVAASTAGAAGLVLGGLLTSELSWRSVMFVNVPIGAGLLLASAVTLLPARPSGERQPLDLPGALSVTAGISTIVYGVSTAPDHGWGSVSVITALVAGVLLLVGFVLIERRATHPLVPRGIFTAGPNITTANILMGLLGAIITAPLFFLSLYLQQVLGESALRAGLSILPMALVLMVGVIVSKRLLPVVGPRKLLIAGSIITAGGLAWLSALPTSSSYLTHILGPTLLAGAGMSILLLPITTAATTGIDPRNGGIASGLINMGRQLGGALGLAVLVTVASSVTDSAHGTAAATVTNGYQTALLVVAGLALLAAGFATRIKNAAGTR
jgi:EmrB/QacA subfamily drug resistance transporter